MNIWFNASIYKLKLVKFVFLHFSENYPRICNFEHHTEVRLFKII